MATASFDSELMTQQVAAIAVPNSHAFVTVRDENTNLMIFSLGSNGIFYVFKEDSSGSRIMLDFGAALKISPATVTAFGVTQNPIDSTLYVAAASVTPSNDGESAAPQTDLLVLKPFQPSDIDVTNSSLDLSELIMPRTGAGETSISSIYMGNAGSAGAYPQVIFTYVPLDKVHKSADMARIEVDPLFDSWQLQSDISLPENASQIVSICPANLPIGVGVFALYEIQSSLQLLFTTTGLQYSFQVVLQCPAGASSLATFIDSDGYTSLLVGGEGLYNWTATECQIANQPGTLLTSDDVFDGVIELFVTQSDEDLSIFAANSSQGIGYAITSTLNPAVGVLTAPLVPNGEGGIFSPLISADGLTLQFIVANVSGNLSMLMQDTKTGLWNRTPFYTPSLSQNVDFRCYTVHVALSTAALSPLANQFILLSSSGWTNVVVNGISVEVGPSGSPVMTDADGTLTLLLPSEDISSYIFTIDNVKGGPIIFNSPITIDPTFKVNNTLSTIQSGSDLMNASLQTGGHLLDGTTVPPDQIDQAAQAIAALYSARQFLAADGSRFERSPRNRRLIFEPGSVRSGKSLGRFLCGHHIDRIRSADSIIDMAWDAWHWMKSQLTKFTSWAVEMATDGLKFIVEIGGNFMRWALDGLTEIGKAMSWVFDKVLEIAKKVIDWLGFLLNWSDIQKTHLSMVAIVNSGLQSGVDNLAVIAQQVDAFFQNLENTVRTAIYPAVLTNNVANPSSTQGPIIDPEKSAENSVKANYTKYQFTHGGAATASSVQGSESSDPLYAAWTNLVEPAFNSLNSTMQTLSDDLVLLFQSNGLSLGVGEVLQKLGADILLGVIDAIRTVVVGLINLGALILADFKTFINYEINIPVFSALYKEFISGGQPLTILDGLALLLAIPVTISTKLITGNAPEDMTSLDYNSLVNGNITDPTQLLQINGFMGVTSWITNTLKGALDGLAGLPQLGISDADNEQVLCLKKFRDQHALETLLLRYYELEVGLENPINMDWQLGFGVVVQVCSIPTDPSQPGYPIRWTSWLIGCANTLIRAAVRKVTVDGVPPTSRAKALAVIAGINGIINFALVSTINGLEFTTESYPGKDPAITTLHTFASVFDLISSLGTDGEVLATDPFIKGACFVANYAGSAFSSVITGAVIADKLAQGQYNYILDKL